ncbi:MAG: glycoside hydrolase family 95 protein, partial [Lachnospiraceae bacterium]|nr:glycoside hydrolase family 95 protein [Lachnospiraceae bacterium]
DYKQYFDRMDLKVADAAESAILPTDERLYYFQVNGNDIGLYELFFHYGRYLLIASSRPGTQATNLQGIWNAQMRAAWSSNYTLNINTQMNYWPVEVCGLSELHEPLFALIEQLAITGAKTAELIYGAGGFTAHHNTDIWRFSTPTGRKGKGTARYAFWPMAAGWLCRHLFEHYEYTLDKAFLKEKAYPLLKKAAEFYLDVLVENKDGELIFAPSTSPENCYMMHGFHGSVSESTAMTQTIVREVFEECLICAELLGESDEWVEKIKKKKEKLKHFVIGADGRILEWNEPMDEPEIQHRHISHLYALYPGMEINRTDTPELAEACRRSLEVRGDVGTGWSLSWKVAAWARLGEGDRALSLFREQLRIVKPETVYENTGFWSGGGVYLNLFDAHPPFQIDGNFGTLAGVAEMYLQSTAHEICLIPALPQKFGESTVRGLCARGRVKVDMLVTGGNLKEAIFYTDQTQERILVCQGHREKVLLEAGVPFVYRM